MTRRKGGTGRKRRDTAKLVEDPAKRQVAFSKRRPTLFNMAGDLSALCGVDTAVIVFSSSMRGTAYAFGSPSVDAVLRGIDGQDDQHGALAVIQEEDDGAALAVLRRELDDTKARVEVEKARMKAVKVNVQRAMEVAGTPLWWQADVNALGPAELPEFEEALRRLRNTVLRCVDALHADAASLLKN